MFLYKINFSQCLDEAGRTHHPLESLMVPGERGRRRGLLSAVTHLKQFRKQLAKKDERG